MFFCGSLNNRKNKYKKGRCLLCAVLLGAAITLVFAYILQTNAWRSDGYLLQTKEDALSQIRQDNKLLRIEISQNYGADNLSAWAQQMGLVELDGQQLIKQDYSLFAASQ